ncbi:MAG: beta-ketoacyl-[acyl-carrier-protein] synthase II [Legionellales bacterium]|nr:beta-ketoacyl-[acyl-carrier-protein] synthase II [Legionellales bacterium]
MQGRRVVVTGYGMLSPCGNSVNASWSNILEGRSGIAAIDTFDTTGFTTQFAGQVKGFDASAYGLSTKDTKKMDTFIQYGIAAAQQAVEDAGLLSLSEASKKRTGVLIGSGIGGLTCIEANHTQLMNSGPKRVSPFFIPSSIINMISGHVAMIHGYKGPNLAVVTACTTGAHAIGMAARTIAYGDADIMLAGGAEHASTPLGVAGFAAARALSTRNDNPQAASRPFDADRDGFVLSDGAGVMVLESYEHAKSRGATIYAELKGFGMSGDAYHITQPSVEGPASAMQNALNDAGLNMDEVQYVNAHGTSTPIGDTNETNAIKLAFGASVNQLMVSSTKSCTGHLLGAAGAVEAIFSVKALLEQVVPPTINLNTPGEGCDLDYVPNEARSSKISAVMSNSFGFGGTNGSLIFTAFK